jgi:hypothetical protein
MILRLRHVCWVIILVFIAGPSHAEQGETIRNLDFATFRIDLLPSKFTVPRYVLTTCVRDLYKGETPAGIPTIDVIEARIEKADGESWAHVYQMLPPEEGKVVGCSGDYLNVHEYCYRSPSQSCEALAHTDSGIKVYRTKPVQYLSPEHLYATIDGTLVVFTFDDKLTSEEIGQALEAVESMTRVTPSKLLSYRSKGAAAAEAQARHERTMSAKEHVDRIAFTKLLPNPRPSGFDRVQGYAYWNQYFLEFQTMVSGESSKLVFSFSDTASSPQLETCWSEDACDFVATTPKDREIYSTWTMVGSSRPGPKVREYYANVEGTLVILLWTHSSAPSEGRPVSRSHEFAPNEIERLIDSLEIATSLGLIRFPGMRVMGSGGGTVRLPFQQVMEKSGSDIEIITPVQTSCIRIRDDGSAEVVGDRFLQIGQNNTTPRLCEP